MGLPLHPHWICERNMASDYDNIAAFRVVIHMIRYYLVYGIICIAKYDLVYAMIAE